MPTDQTDGPAAGRSSRLLAIGLGAIAVAVVLALILVQRLVGTYEDGLEVAAESAAIAADAAVPLERMADDLVEFARAAETGISDARTVLASTQESVQQLGDAAANELAETTEGVASLANRMANLIETIERFIPGDVSSVAEDLRQIADGLAPVPDELRTLGAQLQSTAVELQEADATMVELQESVASLGDELEALTPSVTELSVTADLLVERVEAAQDRVALDLWLARIVVIVVGAVLAIGLVLASGWRGPGAQTATA